MNDRAINPTPEAPVTRLGLSDETVHKSVTLLGVGHELIAAIYDGYVQESDLPDLEGEVLRLWLAGHRGFRAWQAEQFATAVPVACPSWCTETHPQMLLPFPGYMDHRATVLDDRTVVLSDSADHNYLHVAAGVVQEHPKGDGRTYGEVFFAVGREDGMHLTPAEARRLGQALVQAADQVEAVTTEVCL